MHAAVVKAYPGCVFGSPTNLDDHFASESYQYLVRIDEEKFSLFQIAIHLGCIFKKTEFLDVHKLFIYKTVDASELFHEFAE